jgi:hypothetical protein
MRLSLLFAVAAVLSACSGPKLPAPNSADVRYDPGERAVQLMVSGLQPASAAALVANDGARYPASGIALVSGPHVLYNPPPSIGLGIGGFVASALIPVPADYAANCTTYHLEVSVGEQVMRLTAPSPAG